MALNYIQQIKDTTGKTWDISAKYIDGMPAGDLIDMVHGAIETYVIPTSKSSNSNYASIVNSNSATVTTTFGVLKTLIDCSDPKGLRLGDVILMEATSDGTKVFDRWVSANSNDGSSPVSDSDSITLSVLETQVATHHHKLPSLSTSKAITGVTVTSTHVTIPAIGTAVNVLTSAAGKFVTSVAYSDSGEDGKVITHESGTGSVSHSHTVNSHNHSITFKPKSLVSRSIDAVTSVTSKQYTPHTHTSTTVATAATNGTAFTYVTGVSETDTFIKTLKHTSTNTGAATGNTGGSNELSTSTQVSTDAVGDVVKTKEAGTHKHTVTAATTTSVVTAATVAANVVTSVSFSFTAPTVQANVVTSVTKVAKTAASNVSLTGTKTFMSTWSASVDANGVLSFTSTTATVGITSESVTVSGVGTITSGTQSAGSLSISAPRSSQSRTYGAPTISVTCNDAGAHQHGFSHTHKIASHTHSLGSHTHTYDKAGVSASAAAVINLTSSSHTPHTHSSVDVIKTATASTAITYIDTATSSTVVRDLISTDKTFTTTSAAPETNAVYTRLSGIIKFPGITAPTASVTTASTSITPAVTGTSKAIATITLTQTSKNFVTGYSSTISTTKTGANVGGE
jgi:hypothetical protein